MTTITTFTTAGSNYLGDYPSTARFPDPSRVPTGTTASVGSAHYSSDGANWNAVVDSITDLGSVSVTGKLSVGTTTLASQQAYVLGPNVADGALAGQLLIRSTTAYNATPSSGVMFSNQYAAAGTTAGMGGLAVIKENATDGNYASALVLYTRANGSAVSEGLRVSSAGVAVVTALPAASYANDAAAAAGGVPVGGLYNTTGVVHVRLT